MVTHGVFNPFNPASESWSLYIARLRHYFIANDVNDDNKKRSILLSGCGSSTFKLFCNLKPEAELNTTTFDNLVELVKDYYEPKPSQIVQRYKFNTRMRAPQESIVTYVTALRDSSRLRFW